ncbi:SWI/SNF chromatin-remodeling complex subunit [Dispira simplex]|nr:SWI/SNF chromatin-remodeling complex subunit [Dispira simplex]
MSNELPPHYQQAIPGYMGQVRPPQGTPAAGSAGPGGLTSGSYMNMMPMYFQQGNIINPHGVPQSMAMMPQMANANANTNPLMSYSGAPVPGQTLAVSDTMTNPLLGMGNVNPGGAPSTPGPSLMQPTSGLNIGIPNHPMAMAAYQHALKMQQMANAGIRPTTIPQNMVNVSSAPNVSATPNVAGARSVLGTPDPSQGGGTAPGTPNPNAGTSSAAATPKMTNKVPFFTQRQLQLMNLPIQEQQRILDLQRKNMLDNENFRLLQELYKIAVQSNPELAAERFVGSETGTLATSSTTHTKHPSTNTTTTETMGSLTTALLQQQVLQHSQAQPQPTNVPIPTSSGNPPIVPQNPGKMAPKPISTSAALPNGSLPNLPAGMNRPPFNPSAMSPYGSTPNTSVTTGRPMFNSAGWAGSAQGLTNAQKKMLMNSFMQQQQQSQQQLMYNQNMQRLQQQNQQHLLRLQQQQQQQQRMQFSGQLPLAMNPTAMINSQVNPNMTLQQAMAMHRQPPGNFRLQPRPSPQQLSGFNNAAGATVMTSDSPDMTISQKVNLTAPAPSQASPSMVGQKPPVSMALVNGGSATSPDVVQSAPSPLMSPPTMGKGQRKLSNQMRTGMLSPGMTTPPPGPVSTGIPSSSSVGRNNKPVPAQRGPSGAVMEEASHSVSVASPPPQVTYVPLPPAKKALYEQAVEQYKACQEALTQAQKRQKLSNTHRFNLGTQVAELQRHLVGNRYLNPATQPLPTAESVQMMSGPHGGPLVQVLFNSRRPNSRKHAIPIFSRSKLHEQARQGERLVPVRLELEAEGHKLRDTFTWNLNDQLITPELFAETLCEDMHLPSSLFVSGIVRQLNDQLEDYRVHGDVNVAAYQADILTGGPEAEEATSPSSPDLALTSSKVKHEVMGSMGGPHGVDLRVTIQLDITVGNVALIDQFEWDIGRSVIAEAYKVKHELQSTDELGTPCNKREGNDIYCSMCGGVRQPTSRLVSGNLTRSTADTNIMSTSDSIHADIDPGTGLGLFTSSTLDSPSVLQSVLYRCVCDAVDPNWEQLGLGLDRPESIDNPESSDMVADDSLPSKDHPNGGLNRLSTFNNRVWELGMGCQDPERFATGLCADLGLPGEFQTAISHSIREQLFIYTKTLLLLGYPMDGTPVEDVELQSALLPPVESVIRSRRDVDAYTPSLMELVVGELERKERDEDRDIRRKRRQTRGRRGIILPERAPLKTMRTLWRPHPGGSHTSISLNEDTFLTDVTLEGRHVSSGPAAYTRGHHISTGTLHHGQTPSALPRGTSTTAGFMTNSAVPVPRSLFAGHELEMLETEAAIEQANRASIVAATSTAMTIGAHGAVPQALGGSSSQRAPFIKVESVQATPTLPSESNASPHVSTVANGTMSGLPVSHSLSGDPALLADKAAFPHGHGLPTVGTATSTIPDPFVQSMTHSTTRISTIKNTSSLPSSPSLLGSDLDLSDMDM